MIRTADAAGFTGVIVSDKSADIYSLKTLRSMQGSHFHLPIYRMPVAAFVEGAKKSNLPILATTLSRDSKDYCDLSPLENFALVMGNEGQGISPVIRTRLKKDRGYHAGDFCERAFWRDQLYAGGRPVLSPRYPRFRAQPELGSGGGGG